MARKPKTTPGIEARSTSDGQQRYRGHVWSAAEGKRIRGPWFATIGQARNWRQDAVAGVRKGTLRVPVPTTVAVAATAFIDDARAGTVLDRSGRAYQPSSVRNYAGWLRRYGCPRSATGACRT